MATNQANETLRRILKDTQTFVTSKSASFGKQAVAGQDPASMPGSEHDSKVPAEASKPNPETRDGTMVPTSGLSAEGAGDDSPKTRGHALEACQAAENPEKKPAVTADANAKTAEGPAVLCNAILGLIRNVQDATKTAAPVAKVATKTAAAPVVPAPVTKVEPKAEAKTAALNMELTSDVMAKIAAVVLSTDEGAKAVEEILAKQAGAEQAREMLDYLASQSALAEKQASYEAGQAEAERLIAEQIYARGFEAGQTQKQGADFYYKLGQAAADASLEGAAPGGMPAGDVPGADGAAGAMAEPEAGGEEMTLEDIAAALEQLVSDGTLQPEEAQQVMEALSAGGAEGGEGAPADAGAPGAEGGAPADAAGAGAPPPVEGTPEPEPKKEAAAQPNKLLQAIQALRAVKA